MKTTEAAEGDREHKFFQLHCRAFFECRDIRGRRTFFNENKKAGTSGGQSNLWPLQIHQEFFIFTLMQPECPDIPSFAHFAEFCFLV